MKVYGLKTCDTCRAAVKTLGADLRDVRADPLDPEDIARFRAAFGEALVNTRSATWRGLSEAEREDTPERLLARHPALMKRPVIETDDGRLYLGWGSAVKAELL